MALYESVFRVLGEIAPQYAFEGRAVPKAPDCERLRTVIFQRATVNMAIAAPPTKFRAPMHSRYPIF